MAAITILSDLFLLLTGFVRQRRTEAGQLFPPDFLPTVSVLIAARNEAHVIRRCLDSLVAQDYPPAKLEILIGNDASEDETGSIIKEYETRYPSVKRLDITGTMGTARGKANVLAQLVKVAKGEVVLITDADMWLAPGWCSRLVAGFTGTNGIVTGYTAVEQTSFMGRMQATEWALAIGIIKTLTDAGYPVTSMGNNMAVLRSAYEATGGYENMPFSLTEDYQLTREVLRQGFTVRQLGDSASLGVTLPVPSFAQLLKQRKRWMKGAVQLPVWMVLLLGVQAMYYPGAVVGMLFFPWFWSLVLIKWMLQTAFCVIMTRKAGVQLKIADSIGYEIYSAIISLSTLVYSAIPGKVVWKGRKY